MEIWFHEGDNIMKNQKRRNCKDEILDAIKNSNEIKIKDLSKQLGMWDSNLRKKINILVMEEKVEKFKLDKYLHVRIKE